MKNFSFVLPFVAAFALFSGYSHAEAYIDPATTSYVIQLVAAGVIAGGAALAYYWRKLKKKTGIGKTQNGKTSNASVDDQLSGSDDSEHTKD